MDGTCLFVPLNSTTQLKIPKKEEIFGSISQECRCRNDNRFARMLHLVVTFVED